MQLSSQDIDVWQAGVFESLHLELQSVGEHDVVCVVSRDVRAATPLNSYVGSVCHPPPLSRAPLGQRNKGQIGKTLQDLVGDWNV